MSQKGGRLEIEKGDEERWKHRKKYNKIKQNKTKWRNLLKFSRNHKI
jgi:hypothetical protein